MNTSHLTPTGRPPKSRLGSSLPLTATLPCLPSAAPKRAIARTPKPDPQWQLSPAFAAVYSHPNPTPELAYWHEGRRWQPEWRGPSYVISRGYDTARRHHHNSLFAPPGAVTTRRPSDPRDHSART